MQDYADSAHFEVFARLLTPHAHKRSTISRSVALRAVGEVSGVCRTLAYKKIWFSTIAVLRRPWFCEQQ